MTTAQPRATTLAAAPDLPPPVRPVAPSQLFYRLGVTMRALAAIVGGYGLAALTAAAIALYLPGERVDATLIGTLTALTLYPCAAMWAFAAGSAARALLGLLAPGAVLAALVWLAPRLLTGGAV